MTEEAKLIVDTLRYCEESGARCGNCPSGHDERGIPNCHSQSVIADLIESLSAQLEQVEKERDGLNIMLAQAQAMLKTRTKERDAAIRDMTLVGICETCRHHNNSATSKCIACLSWYSNWQWRGVREVE